MFEPPCTFVDEVRCRVIALNLLASKPQRGLKDASLETSKSKLCPL